MTYPIQKTPGASGVPKEALPLEGITQVRPVGGQETAGAQEPDSHFGIPTPGTVLGGRYIVDSVLGEGGMGVVCVGRHLELGQRVAIKFLRSDISKRPHVATRFLDEGRAAASLHSEHVVRVMDVGQLDSGLPYLVMEHLEGTDLEALAEVEGPLDVDCALDYVTQVCSALSEAHANHLVHRDIKPENLFLVESAGRTLVKVLDFGLAKRINSSRLVGLTGPQDSIGSPFYMSPEQIVTPQQVDARTDIWSLGVVLYRFLTGQVPFAGDSLVEVFAHVINAEAVSIRTLRPELDEEIDRVVKRCLAKNVEERYQSIGEFSDDLHRYIATRQRHDSVIPLTGAPDSLPPDVVAEARVEIPGARSRFPAVAVLVVLLVATTIYGASETVRTRIRTVAESAMEALGNGAIARAITGGTLAPSLGAPVDEPLPRPPFQPLLLGPPPGIYTRDPALDRAGAMDTTTIRAEREHEAGPSEPAEDPATAEERVAGYRRYLEQTTVVPTKTPHQESPGAVHDNPY